MNTLYRCLCPALFVAILVMGLGCGGGGGGGGGTGISRVPDTRTPAQYFKEQQAFTVTPHGKILTDTVTEQDGRIRYATEDGKQWSVGYSKRADGTYQYGTPDHIK